MISNGSQIVFLLSMFLNCMLLAVIGKYDGLKNPLRMLLLNLASVDLVATTLGKNDHGLSGAYQELTSAIPNVLFRDILNDIIKCNGIFLSWSHCL